MEESHYQAREVGETLQGSDCFVAEVFAAGDASLSEYLFTAFGAH